MAQQFINKGSVAGDTTGTKARVGADIINENFTELYEIQELLIADSSLYNRIIVSNGFSILDQDITVNANMQWLLANLDYTNPSDIEIFIPFCATGKSRIEYLVPNNENGFTRVFGPEHATVLVAPQLPNKNMYVTFYVVTDNAIGELEPTYFGENFITKQEKAPFQVYNSGEIDNTVLDEFFYGYLNFRGSVTNLKSIQVYSNAFLYSGKEILIKNSQSTDITIYHLTGIGFQFSFPNEANFVLHPNEIIRFSLKITDPTTGVLEYVGKINDVSTVEVADIVGLPEALDLKLDAADYNQHFKSVYLTEAALIAAHPTGVAGDYAQVNEVGSTDVVNYSWDAEENIWVNNGSGGSGAVNTDALPEGSTNFYFTVSRFLTNLTYANVISALGFTPSTAPNDAQKNSDITKAEIEAKLIGEISSHTHQRTDVISLAMSDSTTALVTGDTDPMNAPYNFDLVTYWCGVKTAPTISSLMVDVKKNGVSITSTKAGIDATEKTSLTGTTPVLTTTSFTKGDEITPNIYQVGSGETGKALKLSKLHRQ